MPFTVIGPISAQPAFAQSLLPAGSVVIASLPIPVKHRFVNLVFDLTGLTDLLAVISVSWEFSLDGIAFVPAGGNALNIPASFGYTLDNGGAGPGILDENGQPLRIFNPALRIGRGDLSTRVVRPTLTLSAPAVLGASFSSW